MLIKPTSLIYSSHDRGDYLHREWIVERALQNPYNKTILYLPFSMVERKDQEYSYGTFKWYFQQFEQYGLHHEVFYYHPQLSKTEVDVLLEKVADFEVVILGGGRTSTGFEQLNNLGVISNGDYTTFKNLLQARQNAGKLTVGFSAGAVQIGDANFDSHHEPYSLVQNVVATLHHDSGRRSELYDLSQRFPNCLAFGLPNDSGIACNIGYMESGNKFEVLQMIVDNSWDKPEDYVHMKTRMGMGIEHFYRDGREWTFYGGEVMIRMFSPDYSYQGTWIKQPYSSVIWDYWTQQPSHFHSIEHIFSSH